MAECDSYDGAALQTFKRFGVRGASLPVLSVDHMTGILRMRHDAARTLRAAIDRMMTSYVTTATANAAAAAAASAAGACPTPAASPGVHKISHRRHHQQHQRRVEQAEPAIGVS